MSTAPTRARPDRPATHAPLPVAPANERFLLRGVSWETYELLLRDFEASGSKVRMTYDHGDLEFMTVGRAHEYGKSKLTKLIGVLVLELNIPAETGGNMTCRHRMAERGLEPDECYWVAHEPLMRGKRTFDLDVDPAPDLAIEIEHTRSVLDRLSIYGSLGVAEVWRFDGKSIRVVRPQRDGTYTEQDHSTIFPFLSLADLERFLARAGEQDETSWLRSFRAWVVEALAPHHARPDHAG